MPLELSIKNTKDVSSQIKDRASARQFALNEGYYKGTCGLTAKAGDQIFFSTSYGLGGEAGQGRGRLVAADDGLFYAQEGNPTTQLLLAPGLPFNRAFSGGNSSQSLWEFKQYLAMVNWVVFGEEQAAGLNLAANKAMEETYNVIRARVVDFTGSTGGGSASYSDALELTYRSQIGSCKSDLLVLLAKSVGVVGIEFQENCSPAGTFKMYRASK